jgi:predicted transglutaminase-like cysteine proteinase
MNKTFLFSLVRATIIVTGFLPAACNQGFSHQPASMSQRKMLMTPQDQTVTQALQEALGTGDTSSSDSQPSVVTDINAIRIWVFSNIQQTSDEALHGVNDYWQTPAETLSLKAGDCEDFAMLAVSMLRAYGVPKDQAYVAIGYDGNKDWHAFVLERYSYGAWVEFDPQNLDDAVLLGGNMALPYHISYCFNDENGFNGIPGYPQGYDVPTVSIAAVKPALEPISISSVVSHNQSLDETKRRLGELWLPAYLPADYVFMVGRTDSFSGLSTLDLVYQFGTERNLSIIESNGTAELPQSIFQAGTLNYLTINNQPAYSVIIALTYRTTTSSQPVTMKILVLGFYQGQLQVRLMAMPSDSLTIEELIKIAESLVEY